ncbi:MAG: branched-chain amino acid ABC transporter permease [Actinomycetia bacterium]|nr:branched-chain amino acid ABC transporter permease [Actinomycetes bacterium]
MRESRWVWIGLVAIGVIVPFVTTQTTTYVASLVVITAIAVLGLNYIIRNTGQVSIGHAAVQAFGSYCAGIVASALHADFVVALVAGTLGAAILGLILAVPSVRVTGPYFAVLTLVLGWAVNEAILLYPQVTGGYTGLFVQPFSLFASSTVTMYYLSLAALVAAMALVHNVHRSKFGQVLLVMKRSRAAATTLGVNIRWFMVLAISIGNMLAGLSGVLYLYTVSDITPSAFSLSQSAYFLVASVVGGVGSVFGAILGSAVIVLIPQALSNLEWYANIILGAILIAVLLWRPGGLWPSRARRAGPPAAAAGVAPAERGEVSRATQG